MLWLLLDGLQKLVNSWPSGLSFDSRTNLLNQLQSSGAVFISSKSSFSAVIWRPHSFFKTFWRWQCFTSGWNVLKRRATLLESFQKYTTLKIADRRLKNWEKGAMIFFYMDLSFPVQRNRRSEMLAMADHVYQIVQTFLVHCCIVALLHFPLEPSRRSK